MNFGQTASAIYGYFSFWGKFALFMAIFEEKMAISGKTSQQPENATKTLAHIFVRPKEQLKMLIFSTLFLLLLCKSTQLPSIMPDL